MGFNSAFKGLKVFRRRNEKAEIQAQRIFAFFTDAELF